MYYDADLDWRQRIEARVTELESGPWPCSYCHKPYNSYDAARRCCND